MLGLFKNKSEVDKLPDKYKAHLKVAYGLFTASIKLSQATVAETNGMIKQIEH